MFFVRKNEEEEFCGLSINYECELRRTRYISFRCQFENMYFPLCLLFAKALYQMEKESDNLLIISVKLSKALPNTNDKWKQQNSQQQQIIQTNNRKVNSVSFYISFFPRSHFLVWYGIHFEY